MLFVNTAIYLPTAVTKQRDNVGKYGTAGQTTGDSIIRRMRVA